MSERGFRVEGRVQGVGFRWWTRKTAERLGIVGTVRNLPDGSVEIMARADDEALDRFEQELRQGPPMARVDRIGALPPELARELEDFRVEP